MDGVDPFVQVNLNRFSSLRGYFNSAREAGRHTFTRDPEYLRAERGLTVWAPAFRAPSFYEGDEGRRIGNTACPGPQRTRAMNHVCFASPRN